MTTPASAEDTSKLVTELRIAADHPSFAGHFPRFPILPGAVLLDEALYEIERSRHLDLAQWRVAVKFLEIVSPGDALTLTHSAPTTTTIRFAIRDATRHSEILSGTLAALVTRSDAPGG